MLSSENSHILLNGVRKALPAGRLDCLREAVERSHRHEAEASRQRVLCRYVPRLTNLSYNEEVIFLHSAYIIIKLSGKAPICFKRTSRLFSYFYEGAIQ